ncbi:MAG: hypothetical protein WDW38_006575 [Sanguina aurantia]
MSERLTHEGGEGAGGDEGAHTGLEDVMLQDTWTFRFHDPNNSDWTMPSYVSMANVSSVADMWDVHMGMQQHLTEGMFFVTREHVFPCWDDASNIKGGCISLKVLKTELHTFWEEILIGMLGETLLVLPPEDSCSEDAWSLINGISTSPKRYYCIVKLWLRDGGNSQREHFRLPCNYQGEVLYKSNTEMMRSNLRTDTKGRA